MPKAGTSVRLGTWYLYVMGSLILGQVGSALAQGINIPVGSTVNVATGTLDVAGEVDIDGTLTVTTGAVLLTGNWDNAGTFTSGTGTVNFTGTAGTQTVNSGGTGVTQDFYDFIHSGAGTLQIITNDVDIDDDVTISAGTWDLNGRNVTVEGDWNQSGAGALADITNSSTVTLDGTNQAFTGSTSSFWNLTKIGNNTLTLQGAAQQRINGTLTLQGTGVATELTLTSDNPGVTQHQIFLAAGGLQDLEFLNVRDGNATNLDLVARNSNNIANNDTGTGSPEWRFTGATFIWDGDISTDWDTPGNWNLGTVPTSTDTVLIPDTSAGSNRYPTLAAIAGTGVTVTNLSLTSAVSTLTLADKDLTVSTTFSNVGTIILMGTETVTLTPDIDSGTFNFVGDGDNIAEFPLITDYGAGVDYFNLIINDPAPSDTYRTTANLNVAGSLTVTSGTLDIATNDNDLTVGVDLTVNTTLNAGTSNIDVNDDFILSGGTFTAPITGNNFTIAGDFTNSGGTFTAGTGTVTLDGVAAQFVSASATTFNNLYKVTANGTLTFDTAVATTPTVTGTLTMQGTAGNDMAINSNNPPTQAPICLAAGGIQSIQFVDVTNSNAGPAAGCLTLVARGAGSSLANTNNWALTATFTWQGDDGTTPTNWNTAQNWDLGLVPSVDDTVIIPNVVNDPVLTSNVQVENVTIQAGAVVALGTFNFTVDSAFSNEGNVTLVGSQTVTLTGGPDVDSGTFTYLGDGTATLRNIIDFGAGVDYYNLVLSPTGATPDTFQTTANLTTGGNVNLTAGALNISTNSNTLIVGGNLDIDGGTFTGTNGVIDVNGSFDISGGTFTAPTAGSFTVADDWLNTGGTFNANGGTVTLDSTTTANVTGNTTFNNLTISTPLKTVLFAAGSNQTVNGTLTMAGSGINYVTLNVATLNNADQWSITIASPQNVNNVHVSNSDALTNTITCFNCVDGGQNNANWIFQILAIDVPVDTRIVDTTPTVIGRSTNIGATIEIRDNLGTVIATTSSDASTNFRVEIPAAMAVGANTLQAFIGAASSNLVNIVVQAAPVTNDVPTLTSHADGDRVNGATPTIAGQGLANQAATIMANDASGNLLLSTVGSGTVDGSGNYSITLTTPLPKGVNNISVTVNGVATTIISVTLTDPFGTVFDPVTDLPLDNATVTLYRASDNQPAVVGVDLDAADTNPIVTDSTGVFAFLAVSGDYYFTVSRSGYLYPSQATVFGASRSVITGSKGEVFTVASAVLQVDQPMDPEPTLVRIEKSANKSEVSVGGIVTYTITIENKSNLTLANTTLQDFIPAGFKYVNDRVTLDGVPIANPSGNRPVSFSLGTLNVGQTKVLKYQLVVGAGVTFGTYENSARVKASSGSVISNTATEGVQVVADPLFDLGNVIGKVFYDLNENGVQDEPFYNPMNQETIKEAPVPNVRIVMEDGTVVISDQNGLFHLPALTPGRHLFRLDERTLPLGTYLTTDKAVIVDITQGLLAKVNFGINIDSEQSFSEDEVFFNQKVSIVQDKDRAVPRLHIAVFNDPIVVSNDAFLEQVEFRAFTNYAPFIENWKLDISDKDTKKLVKRFTGTRYNIHDPIYWDGLDNKGDHLRLDRNYEFTLYVEDAMGNFDETKAQDLKFSNIKEEEDVEKFIATEAQKARKDKYQGWLREQSVKNSLLVQTILVEGETIVIDRTGANVKGVRIMKDNSLLVDVPIVEKYGLTAKELLEGNPGQVDAGVQKLEVILPRGDYEIVVQDQGAPTGQPIYESAGEIIGIAPTAPEVGIQTTSSYSKNIKVGEDYLMFVAMGDAKIGYTMTRGNIEPVRPDDKFVNGFWSEGKMAYYVKGKIKGKYLITSSFDTERERKELFKNLDPDDYYPIYGDSASVDYDATNTQGNLYLLLEWDQSSVQWSNYAVDFNDTEFAKYSRTLYGGKIDLQSVSRTKYGDPRSKLIAYRAKGKQKSAHNEFLSTGGSLYFIKHKDIVEGSDNVRVEVRDKVTGLVKSSKVMKEGADYELDYDSGRLLFWQPIEIIANSESIISSSLLDGDPLYVVIDYEYSVVDKVEEDSYGFRAKQAIGENVVAGTTYVVDKQDNIDYSISGADVTAHLGKDATVVAEVATSQSQSEGTFVSTDGGLSFTELSISDASEGIAYGLKADARLFNRVGFSSYYKWVDQDFSTSATSAQQGKEISGFSTTVDVTETGRVSIRHDIQTLLDGGNAQTATQVGSARTATTLVQYIQEIRRLKITTEYQRQETGTGSEKIVSETVAARADMALDYDYTNDKLILTIEQQAALDNTAGGLSQTTIGLTAKPTDALILTATEVISNQGFATTFGIESALGKEAEINDNLRLIADYSFITDESGEMGTMGSIGAITKLNDSSEIRTVLGVNNVLADPVTSLTIGGTSKLGLGDDNTTISTDLQMLESAGDQTTKLIVSGTEKVNEKTESTTSFELAESSSTGQSTSYTLGTKSRIADDLELISSKTFGISETAYSTSDEYGLTQTKGSESLAGTLKRSYAQTAEDAFTRSETVGLTKTKDGNSLTGSLARAYSQGGTEAAASRSNIFGLSGDIGETWAVQVNYERGDVQNLDGTTTDRDAISAGLGYVLKDPETGELMLQSSTKVEVKFDKGTTDTDQFLISNSIEGKVTPELNVFAKVEFSKTRNTSDQFTAASHREIVLGTAYRPIMHDRLNLMAKYTYLEDLAPSSQVDSADIQAERGHVIAAEAIYDIDEHWQISEKFAYRLNEEKVSGFDFTKTHTWLMVHRLNYKINQDWLIGGEFRMLTQEEAQDVKRGLLIEAARRLGEYAQLGVGFNFTEFNDELTHLDYHSFGPYVRMTGKFYDRTPDEIERSRQKWIDLKVGRWAWVMVSDELTRSDSPIIEELNSYFILAEKAKTRGDIEESHRIYKDIVTAGQMMFDEASEFIRKSIHREEKLQEMKDLADAYYKQGEYEKAKKILEKIVVEAQNGVLE